MEEFYVIRRGGVGQREDHRRGQRQRGEAAGFKTVCGGHGDKQRQHDKHAAGKGVKHHKQPGFG